MLRHPFLALVHSIGKALDHIRVFFDKALFGKIRGVGHLSRFLAHSRHDVALALGFHGGCRRLEHRHIVACAAQKRTRHVVELDAVVQQQVGRRVHAVFADGILKRHIRHAALAARQDVLARQLIPGKAGVLFAPHQKAAVAFRYLRKHLGVVLFTLVVYIDAGLRPRKADVHVAGKHRAHHFVRAAAVGKLHVQPLVREEALCQRHILRRIENGMRHLAHRHLLHFLCLAAAARQSRQHQTHTQEKRQTFFHLLPPFLYW